MGTKAAGCRTLGRTKNTPVNTQNVSATKIVDSSSIQRAETKYGLRIQFLAFLALIVMIHEVWLNAKNRDTGVSTGLPDGE